MIFNWINHPSFRRDEQLLAVLYELGIATRRQLAIVSGWSEQKIEWSFKRIRKWGRDKEEKDEWLRCYRLSLAQNRIGAYTLGRRGLQYVANMMGDDKPRRRPLGKGQIAHSLGVNEILCRLLLAGVPRENISWLSTLESVDFLAYVYEARGLPFDARASIRPDARLIIEGKPFWLEFDNSTEGPRKLERKFHEYIETLYHEKTGWLDSASVVWVTIDESRRTYLEKLWFATRIRFPENRWPQMRFFTAGDEVDFLLSRDSVLI